MIPEVMTWISTQMEVLMGARDRGVEADNYQVLRVRMDHSQMEVDMVISAEDTWNIFSYHHI